MKRSGADHACRAAVGYVSFMPAFIATTSIIQYVDRLR
jgi:hypothetical protein